MSGAQHGSSTLRSLDGGRRGLRVACVQLDSKRRDVRRNMETVRRLTASLRPGQTDLLVLPEMALAGYLYPSAASILPVLERPEEGPSVVLAKELAGRLGCWVVAGFGERGPMPTPEPKAEAVARDEEEEEEEAVEEPMGYNSALLVSPQGALVDVYRKTNLFPPDKVWARPGEGFTVWELPWPLGRVCVGICMDLNPKDFTSSPYTAFELAAFALLNRVDTLVLPQNWSNDPSAPELEIPTTGPSGRNMRYWLERLAPVWDTKSRKGMGREPPTRARGGVRVCERHEEEREAEKDQEGDREMVLVVAGRVGQEDDTYYVGSSSVWTLPCPAFDAATFSSPAPVPTSRAVDGEGQEKKIRLEGCLNQVEEGVLVVSV